MNSKKIFLAVLVFCLLLIILIPFSTKAAGLVTCGTTCTNGTCTNQCTICDFFKMLVGIYNFIVTVIATPLAVLAFTIGGIFILVSAGNPNLGGLGRKILWSAAIGLVLVFLSWLIIDFVLHAIGYSNASNWSSLNLSCSSSGYSGGGSPSASSSNVYPSKGSGVTVTQPPNSDSPGTADVPPDTTPASLLPRLTGDESDTSFNAPNNNFRLISYALADLTLQSGAIMKIYHSDGTTPVGDNDPVVNGDKIIVTSGDGKSTATYIIKVNANASVTSGTYSLSQPSGTTPGAISMVLSGTSIADFSTNLIPTSDAIVQVFQSDGMTPATGTVVAGDKVVVTAKDGTTGIYIISIASNNASLNSSAYTVSPLSNGTGGTGTISGVPSSTSVSDFLKNLTPTNNAKFSVYRNDGTTPEVGLVNSGDKVISTSEDKTKTGAYTINVISSDASLTSSDYNVSSLSNGTSGTGTITGVPSDTTLSDLQNNLTPADGATFAIYESNGTTPATNPIVVGDQVIVTAQDGTTKATYTITISASTNASLTSSVYTVGDLSNGYATIINVPYGTSVSDFSANITPAPHANFAVYQSNGTTPETNNIITGDEVIVTAQDNSTTGTYVITLNRNSNASITSPSFTISALSGSTHGTGRITDVPSGTSVYDFKNHITPATGATFNVYQSNGTTPETGNVVNGDNVIVTAQNNTNTATYTITVSQSSDASVSSLNYTVSALSGPGGKSGTGTITDVPFGISVNDFSVTPAAGAIWSVYLHDGTTLETGNIITGDEVIVTAEDWTTTGTYTITVNKNPDASLTSSVYSISGLYYGYGTISNIPFGTLAADFKTHLTPADGATFDVYKSNETTLETGKIVYGDEVIVTAQDGKTKGIYSTYVNANTASPIATITSDIYTVSNLSNTTNGTGQITDVSFGTSATIFKTHLTPATGATFEVYLTDGVTPETGNVVSNDEVIVTAANETTTATYTITVSGSSGFTITTTAGTGGTITPSGGTVTAGSSHSYTISPDNGYHISSVYLDGTLLANNPSGVALSNISANHTISATFSVGSSDASLTSSLFTVSALSGGTSGTGTITNVPNGINNASLFNGLTSQHGAVFAVYQSTGIHGSPRIGTVVTGDEVISFAADGISQAIYTITVLADTYTIDLSTNLDCVNYTTAPAGSPTSCYGTLVNYNLWCGLTGTKYYWEGSFGGKTDSGSNITLSATLKKNGALVGSGYEIDFVDPNTGTISATTNSSGVATATIPSAWQQDPSYNGNCLHWISASYYITVPSPQNPIRAAFTTTNISISD